MTRILTLVLATLLCLYGCSESPQYNSGQPISVSQIFRDVESYDGAYLTVVGHVSGEPRTKVSRRGNPYYTFTLMDDRESDTVTVFSFGKPPSFLKDGARVTVEGTYHRTKRVGRYTFYNEIEAKGIRPR